MQEYSGGLSTIWWLFNRYMSCLYRPSSNLNSLFLITTWKARFEFRILGFLMTYSYSYHPHSTLFFNAPPPPFPALSYTNGNTCTCTQWKYACIYYILNTIIYGWILCNWLIITECFYWFYYMCSWPMVAIGEWV